MTPPPSITHPMLGATTSTVQPKALLASLPLPTQQLASALAGLGLGQPVRCVVAYSGGVDSSCLLHCAHQLQTLGLVQVVAAYVHHGWRGTPAPELPKLHKLTHQLNVPFFYLDATTQHSAPPAFEAVGALPSKPSSEGSARQKRYTLLAQLAQQLQANVVLTAHHQDDQLETVLFRLFRGTGLDGLEGIQQRMVWQGSGQSQAAIVLRPWLTLPRAALQTHAETYALPTFNDPTNTVLRHTRNAIRHKVWPVIEEVMPQARASLSKLLQVVQAERSILNDVTQDLWHRIASPATLQALPQGTLLLPNVAPGANQLNELAPKAWVLDDKQLGQLPTAYQWRLLRHWLKEHGCSPTLDTVDKLQSFMAQRQAYKGKAPRLSLGNNQQGKPLFALLDESGLRMVTDPTAARLALQQARELHATELPWPIAQPLKIQLGWKPGWVLVIRPLPHHRLPTHWQKLVPNPKSRRLWVHLEEGLLTGLTVRTRRTGDRIQPLGYPQSTSVRRYFINKKVPLLHRDEWLCLANDNQVLWLPGLTVSEALWVDDWRWPTHEVWLAKEDEANDLTAFAGVDGADLDDETDTALSVDADDADTDDVDDDDDSTPPAKPHNYLSRAEDDETGDDDDDDDGVQGSWQSFNARANDDNDPDEENAPSPAPRQGQGAHQRTYRRGGGGGRNRR